MVRLDREVLRISVFGEAKETLRFIDRKQHGHPERLSMRFQPTSQTTHCFWLATAFKTLRSTLGANSGVRLTNSIRFSMSLAFSNLH